MAYDKQIWQTGDVITAEKLNHIENGIESLQLVTTTETVRFNGSVTTVDDDGDIYAELDCNLSDAPEQIKVIFDGTEYTCEKIDNGGYKAYGGFNNGVDFSEYPFAITVSDIAEIWTETASTHQVEIVAITKSVNEDLADLIPVMQVVNGVTNSADAVAAFNAGKLLYFTYENSFYIVTGINDITDEFIFTPSNNIKCDFSGVKIAISSGTV